jgi:4-amino-4-deoxy-L-arabinose transferase-like glycosyltransferase
LIIACPECSGKLSSVAPSCPHCGFVQAHVVKSLGAPAPAPPSAPPEPPPPELILPSDNSVRKASRLVWSEWIQSSIWRLFFGAVTLLMALGLMILAFLVANRMNDSQPTPVRVEKPSTP